ncbi:MAG: SOS response-associated peptidase [Desulfuromonadaceae bacterium]|nr:SOS response-associated peptidase [Desulfuromonadaceae bacterium]
MCGRMVINLSPETITEIYGIIQKIDRERNPRYNVAPTQDIPIVRQNPDGARSLTSVHWGLIPSWAKDLSIGNRMINARAETLAEKPAFRAAFKHRRCLVPASGYYEWQQLPDGRKQPYYIHPGNDAPLTLAGLWEQWHSPEGTVIESCTVITTSANKAIASIHERMPVILPQSAFNLWLDDHTQRDKLTELLVTPSNELLTLVPVSTMVNSPRHTGPECIKPVDV